MRYYAACLGDKISELFGRAHLVVTSVGGQTAEDNALVLLVLAYEAHIKYIVPESIKPAQKMSISLIKCT